MLDFSLKATTERNQVHFDPLSACKLRENIQLMIMFSLNEVHINTFIKYL